MLQEPMMEKLTAMRLLGMVDALKAQEQDPAARELSFLERLGLLVDQQWTWRENQALARRLLAAKLKGASVEDIDYRTSRGLDKSVIRALAQKSVWAANHENIFVLGPTGVGKSFVACALAQKACRDGYSALYLRAAALFRDLAIARADGSLRSLLARLSRIDVLVIDDWAMAPLAETERRDFWEICEDRYQTRSTILTSQLPVAAGTNRSAIPLPLTVSSTAWFTTLTASKCVVIPCVRNVVARNPRAKARRSLCVLRRGQGLRPFPRTPFSASGALPPLCSGHLFLTKTNTCCTIEVPASLRSENCSPSVRNAVRVPFGISVRLRRNPQPGNDAALGQSFWSHSMVRSEVSGGPSRGREHWKTIRSGPPT